MADAAVASTLRRASNYAGAGDWPAAEAVDTLTLDFDNRHRRRLRLTADGGMPVLLDLPRAVAMAEGGGLALDGGGWLAIRAATEPVMEVTCATPTDLARIAWHLGNRHLPTQIAPAQIAPAQIAPAGNAGTVLRIRPDHVIAAMLEGLGAAVRHTEAPFQPEGGAYGQGQVLGHGHGHAHGHVHAHGHSHTHDHHHHPDEQDPLAPSHGHRH